MADHNRFDATLAKLDKFPPTVCGHTRMSDGYELETTDNLDERNIDLWTDGTPPTWKESGEPISEQPPEAREAEGIRQ
jgi:hypothetical protein